MHDAANRLVARENADGLTEWFYGAGAEARGGVGSAVAVDATNGDTGGAHGRLILTRNATTTERFAYDAEGRLARHARELGGHAFVTRYTHDGRGRLVDKSLPDGQTLRHHYHDSGPDRGRLRAITRGRWFGLADETLVGEIDLDARDGTSGHVTHGGLSTRRRFTPAGELESIVAKIVADNEGTVQSIRDGNAKAIGALVGQVMKATQGKANPKVANELLRTAIDAG